ncbi:MAG: hypothetical protein LBS62_07830, partial [Clostridiales bacterium]|nr:hypothetical protein [Clostridiales bacterium]
NNWGIETSSNIRPDPGARLVVYPGAILTNIWSRNLLTGAAIPVAVPSAGQRPVIYAWSANGWWIRQPSMP